MSERESLCNARSRLVPLIQQAEVALQRVPGNLDWIADEGEPAMDALLKLRREIEQQSQRLDWATWLLSEWEGYQLHNDWLYRQTREFLDGK